ncbi:MAG: hypothetical protein ACRC76_11630 [Proteocatella sp.]
MDIVKYFDDRVLGALYTVTLIGVAVTFLLTYSVYKKSYINQITLGLVLGAIGMILITMRDYISESLSIIIGNSAAIIGLYIIYDGMVIMIGRKTHLKMLETIAALFSIMHMYFTFVNPNFTARVINFSVFNAFGAIYISTQFFLQTIKKFEYIIFIVFLTHLISVFIDAMRIYDAFKLDRTGTLFAENYILKYLFLYSIFIAIVRIICVMLYNTKDLV